MMCWRVPNKTEAHTSSCQCSQVFVLAKGLHSIHFGFISSSPPFRVIRFVWSYLGLVHKSTTPRSKGMACQGHGKNNTWPWIHEHVETWRETGNKKKKSDRTIYNLYWIYQRHSTSTVQNSDTSSMGLEKLNASASWSSIDEKWPFEQLLRAEHLRECQPNVGIQRSNPGTVVLTQRTVIGQLLQHFEGAPNDLATHGISLQIGNQISQQVGSAMSAAAWMFNPWRTNWLDVVGVTTILTTIILS